ncbi:MAG: hypothetical protein V4789_26145, partial [Burkholderia gladioli]
MRRHTKRRDALAHEQNAAAPPTLEATSSGFQQRLSARPRARQYRHEKNWVGTRAEIAKLGLDPGSAMAFVAERGRR